MALKGLLGVVVGVKQGKVKLADVRPGIRKKVERMAGELTKEQAQEYASTGAEQRPRAGDAHSKLRNVRE